MEIKVLIWKSLQKGIGYVFYCFNSNVYEIIMKSDDKNVKIERNFVKNISKRILGSLIGACVFFVVTNFGVWSLGSYGYSINGFIACYTLAIPFFAYSVISTLFFSSIFEGVYKFYKIKFEKFKLN